jgi:hypothetical protein
MRSHHTLLAVLVCFVVAICAAPVFAQANDLQGEVVGAVQRVSADQHKLSVRDTDNRVWTFMLTDSTKLLADGREAKLADFKVGETIDVVYSMNGYVPKLIQKLPQFK